MDNFKYIIRSFPLINASTTVAVALSTATGLDAVMLGRQYFVFEADIQALFSNTGFIAVGNAPIPTNGDTYIGTESGYQLAAGGQVSIRNIDLSEIKLLPYTANDGLILTVHLRQTH